MDVSGFECAIFWEIHASPLRHVNGDMGLQGSFLPSGKFHAVAVHGRARVGAIALGSLVQRPKN